MPAGSGRYPSGQRGQTVNLLAYAFGGSNPPLPTIGSDGACTGRHVGGLSEERGAAGRAVRVAPVRAIETSERVICGNSSAVERQPSKLGVAGSNPVSRSTIERLKRLIEEPAALPGATSVRGFRGHVGPPMNINFAHVAQSAERVLGKDEVSGSIPDMGSTSTQS